MKDQKPEIRQKILETKDLDAEAMKGLDAAIAQFKSQWTVKKPAKELARV